MNFKTVTFATLALFLSGADARGVATKLNELRHKAPKASRVAVATKKIMSNDPLVDEQDEFFDMVKFSQKAFKNLSEQEIKEMIEENPELEALTKPAPFDREMVSGLIDSETGVEINEKDILDLMEMNKKMAEHIEKAQKDLKKKPRARKGSSKNGHRRNLAAEDDAEDNTNSKFEDIKVSLAKMDPIIWKMTQASNDMNNYKEAHAAIAMIEGVANSEEAKEQLAKSEELRVKGTKALQTSYRWLKTSSSVLYRLLKRVQRAVISRDRRENQIDLFYEQQYELQTMEEQDAMQEEIDKANEELDRLYDEIMETEDQCSDALDTFGEGIETAQKYLDEATVDSAGSRKYVDGVKSVLDKLIKNAEDIVNKKGDQYNSYAKEQRAIAYGTCAGVCATTGILTGGASCVACYATAAGILESKLKDYRDANEKLAKNLKTQKNQVHEVYEQIGTIIDGLDDLDHDIVGVGELLVDAQSNYEDIKNTNIVFLTEDASSEDGTFAEFMEMLERSINYERNLRTCGTPDCRSTCMMEPLTNEGSDYKGCWNQSASGLKCKNWTQTPFASVGNNNYCRDPDNKGDAWCYLEGSQEGEWEYCI